ncbi:MAG: DNA ligase, partial [Chitinophagaceae bacterium]
DKKAKKVVLEKETSANKIVKTATAKKSTESELLTEDANTQNRKINGKELQFTNLNKVYWPIEKITKRQLINYYDAVSEYILPYLKNRPQSLNRHPNGIDGQSFYQKDVTGKVPDWIDTYLYHAGDSDVDKHFLLGNNKATLLYMASLGCIEINPWNSTTKKPDHPTWCILDLDPDKQIFNEVIAVALETKAVLDEMNVPCYCKTSGSTGLHIYIPLGAKYTYEQSKEFARIIVTLVNRRLPKLTSLERTIKDRKGKMYLDFLQNRSGATVAAPYSVRPKPGATVSMPLAWDEVKKGLKLKDFTIFNALERINDIGDIFKPVLGKGIDLRKVLKDFTEKGG